MKYHKIHTETSLALDLLLEIFVNWFMDKSTGYDVTKRRRCIKKAAPQIHRLQNWNSNTKYSEKNYKINTETSSVLVLLLKNVG